jgi:hypothetical protein
MKKYFLLFILSLLVLVPFTPKVSAGAYWQSLAHSPDVMFHNGGAFDGQQYFYIVGGRDANFNSTSRFQRYNILTDMWEVLPPAPKPMFGSKVFYAHNALYILAGATANSTREFLKYDLETGTWSTLPNIPGSFIDSGGAAYDGNTAIYASTFSGRTFSSAQFEDFPGMTSCTSW